MYTIQHTYVLTVRHSPPPPPIPISAETSRLDTASNSFSRSMYLLSMQIAEEKKHASKGAMSLRLWLVFSLLLIAYAAPLHLEW